MKKSFAIVLTTALMAVSGAAFAGDALRSPSSMSAAKPIQVASATKVHSHAKMVKKTHEDKKLEAGTAKHKK